MKQVFRAIAYVLLLVSAASLSAAVPQLSILGTDGGFTHIEVPDGFSMSHSTDSIVLADSIPHVVVNFPSGRSMSMPVNAIESYQVVNPVIPAFNIHFTDYPDAEQLWLKEDYIKATLDIHGNGAVEDQLGLELTMKGRGNTTWGMAKKPMRLKFAKKVSLCGFAKAKNYVLLANYMDQTHLHNSVALWTGQSLGVPYTNHFQPVDVFVNDRYVGLFLLTEKVGINSGSVDIEEENGILFELSVEYDEKYKFRSPLYDMPVMVKDPDFDDLAEDNPEGPTADQRLAAWREDFTAAEAKANAGRGFDVFDLDSFVKFILVQDIVNNEDTGWPKSVYIYKTALGEDTKYVFGPIWDFDITQDMIVSNTDGILEYRPFDKKTWIHRLFERMTRSATFKSRYTEIFNEFFENDYPRLLEFIDAEAERIAVSAELDGRRWPESRDVDSWAYRIPSTGHAAHVSHLKEWLQNRMTILKQRVDAGLPR